MFCVQELTDIRQANSKIFRDIVVDESNILAWNGLVVPVRSVWCTCVCELLVFCAVDVVCVYMCVYMCE